MRFPDIPEAFTEGEDLEESLVMAQDVLAMCLAEYASANQPAPKPSDIESLDFKLVEQMEDAGIDTSRKPFIQIVSAPEMETKVVKLNISMPKFSLDAIDKKAERYGLSRSGFLVRAALAYSEQ